MGGEGGGEEQYYGLNANYKFCVSIVLYCTFKDSKFSDKNKDGNKFRTSFFSLPVEDK